MKRWLCTYGIIFQLIGLMALSSFALAVDKSGQASIPASQNPSAGPEKTKEKVDNSQVVLAIVNGHKITQAELDTVSAFPLNSIADPALRAQARNKILLELIDEYLVEQDIVSSGLVKNPIFTPLLEREKRTAALNLYQLFRANSSPPKLTSTDIDTFIRASENFFSKRKTWHYFQFFLPPQSTNTISLEELGRPFKSSTTNNLLHGW